MKASDLVVRCLENEGVDFSSLVPGEETWTSWTRSRVPASDSSRRGTSRARRSWPMFTGG